MSHIVEKWKEFCGVIVCFVQSSLILSEKVGMGTCLIMT